MLKKPHYIIVIFVVLAVVALFRLPEPVVGRLKLAISGLFLPLFGLAGSAHEAKLQARGAFISRRELIDDIETLKQQNQQLQIQLQQEQEIERENARLRAQIGWAPSSGARLRLARIIARDPANWWRALTIDLGSRDGLRPDLAVRTAAGLVGKIASVTADRSQVVLLGNPNLRVAALVQQTGETGVIMPGSSSPQEDNMVDLGYLAGNSPVAPGQTVITWGGGGIFPGGIPIGRVVDVRINDYGLSKDARVQLWANLNSLEEVWVMMP